MRMRNFNEMVQRKWDEGKYLRVGLDSNHKRVPVTAYDGQFSHILHFNKEIVLATQDLVCAYKPNAAFYDVLGPAGFSILRSTIDFIHEQAPGVPVILDGKRNDIGATCEVYAEALFDTYDADAVTTVSYLGTDGLEPFLKRPEKGVFVLCRTSNKSAGEQQDLMVDGRPLYLHVAEMAAKRWNSRGNCGLVVGATWPKEMEKVREVAPTMTFLVPGIGTQGADLEATIKAGGQRIIINASSSVIFAGQQEKHRGKPFDVAARVEALELHDNIREIMTRLMSQEAL